MILSINKANKSKPVKQSPYMSSSQFQKLLHTRPPTGPNKKKNILIRAITSLLICRMNDFLLPTTKDLERGPTIDNIKFDGDEASMTVKFTNNLFFSLTPPLTQPIPTELSSAGPTQEQSSGRAMYNILRSDLKGLFGECIL